ncbi:MAG: ATP-dependent Clp protease ATP-binding subunit [Prevotellaceae bacterium]|nr:ATP-dependent Clp protease ATP-binding subunit [Prevotellaceae bacterium]
MNLGLSFTEEVNKIITYSCEEAMRLGDCNVFPEHLVLGILRHNDNNAVKLITGFVANPQLLKKKIEKLVKKSQAIPFEESKRINITPESMQIIGKMTLEARNTKDNQPSAIHLLLAILHEEEGLHPALMPIFKEYDIDYASVYAKFTNQPAPIKSSVDYEEDDDEIENKGTKNSSSPKANSSSSSAMLNTKPQSDTPVLDNYGVDLTATAKEGKLDPVIGREKEIERLAQILSRRKKNNPALIGEPGVGKSAIAEGLALRIAQRKVSRILLDKRIIALDVASIVAGTKYRGQFEERMKAILNELTKTPNLILFIDELHTLVGAGGAGGSLDAANMLKPALAHGEIQCIGATTLDEYRQHIEKDGALERRFQKIMVEPTSPDETVEILMNIKERYEKHHNALYTPEALRACVYLTQRYITDRCLPDKAIDAMDEAGARVRIAQVIAPSNIEELENKLETLREEKRKVLKAQDYIRAAALRDEEVQLQKDLGHAQDIWQAEQEKCRETVDAEKVAEVVSMMANIPIHRVAEAESARLMKMGKALKGKVIGQNEAVDKLVRAIQRNRAGLKDPNKPIGSFVFLGPTGVGKTQLAKVLTEYLFDSADNMIRIDMSEYMEKYALSRLIGAPPGYVGYEEGGQLTERVRRKPYAVVLLDEIEKAHPDIFNLLLQVLDEGMLNDSTGRKIDFRNTVLIMTSNIGSRELKDFGQGVGFANATKRNIAENTRSIIEKSLRKTFTPEFLNRVDEQILFNSLSQDDIYKIIDIELDELYSRIKRAVYEIEISAEAKKFVAEQGYDPQFGARPLKRAIQRYFEDPIAETVLQQKIKIGETLRIGLTKDGKETRIEN